ncbi:MAG: chemotaxis protein CheB [Myxococcota bacterium]
MEKPKHVVGIGASAGGLDALENLFRHMPRQTGSAFIIVQHLSPDFKSMMDEILARDTEIPILQAEHGLSLSADHIYLSGARQDMIVSGGKLLLTEHEASNGIHLPVDIFFSSLASEYGKRSVGVVLSGTGSDGTRGVQQINAAGGLVIVQEPGTTRFSGMPEAAVATGVVNHALPPAQIADALTAHLQGREYRPSSGALASPVRVEEHAIHRIFAVLNARFGIDFQHYRPTTVDRRLERRLELTRSESIEDYVQYLLDNPLEADHLYKDLLIGVTEFFRDKKAFQTLKDSVLPELLSKVGQRPLRIWTPGCATGAEAYSLAIAIDECRTRLGKNLPVKIFATDVHQDSLERASAGIFDSSIEAQVSADRLERYFNKSGSSYEIIPEIRRMLVFAPQNVLGDAPFTNLHMIVCRNLLIYFEPAQQLKVLSLFLFGLRRDGILFLGRSESLGSLSDRFETLSSEWKIFRKTASERLPIIDSMPVSVSFPRKRRPSNSIFSRVDGREETHLNWAYESLLSSVMSAGLLVDAQRRVVHVFGVVDELLAPVRGRPSDLLVSMIKPELASIVSAALHRSDKEGHSVVYRNVKLERETGGDLYLTLTATPLQHKRTGTRFHFVRFEIEQEPEPTTEIVYQAHETAPSRVADLESELQYTKEHLQATNEELETSNEELQAANEELLAANEELQSTNEELQSTNEELQSANEELHSVNEELHTVNAEYNVKIRELREVTSDLENLLHSTDLGVVFLDRELRVRRFTPATSAAIALRTMDVGKPFDHIAHGLGQKKSELYELALKVLHERDVQEVEMRSHRDQWFMVHILPYLNRMGESEGVVLTFRDITDSKHLSVERERYTAKLEATSQDLQDFAYVASHDLQAPLRAITSYIDLLQEDPELSLNETQAKRMDSIHQAGTQMKSLVDGLLSFSRIHTRAGTVEERDCNQLLDGALESCAVQIQERGVIINRSLLPRLQVDPTQFQQLLLNLIVNAITFNRSPIPQVDIAAVFKDDEWLFTVSDNGIGIPEKYHKDAFVIFRRFNTGQEFDGSGIGLAVCKRIVQRHHGQIWLESSQKDGTTVSFTIPIQSGGNATSGARERT